MWNHLIERVTVVFVLFPIFITAVFIVIFLFWAYQHYILMII